MGLGTGITCKYCKKQIYMDDDNANEEEEICGKYNATKKILRDLRNE